MSFPSTTGVAMIGLGMVSPTYAAALADLSDRLTLRGVLARRPESAARWMERHPGLTTRAYASAAEIAADPDVAFVILATPPNAREAFVETLAAAGKPILMEKPVERTLDAAERLCEIAESHGVAFGVMLNHRARPAAKALGARIAGGDLGALLTVEVSIPWWRPQSYYDEPGRGAYARDGGGVLISQAIHTLDLMLSFAGPVAETIAFLATSGFHRMEAEDFVSAGLRFRSGAIGSIFATTASYPGRGETITLGFEKATARLDTNMLTLDWLDGRSETVGEATASGSGADPMAFTSDWHRDMIADFADALAEGRPPRVTAREALGVHRLIAALEESGRSGRHVVLRED